jgi:hypothetical protein
MTDLILEDYLLRAAYTPPRLDYSVPPEPLNLAAIYRRAADLLERDGWAHGRAFGPYRERCTTTAVTLAAGRTVGWDHSDDLYQPLAAWLAVNRWDQVELARWPFSKAGVDSPAKLAALLNSRPDVSISFIRWWNDTTGRTQDEVVSVLRDCADTLDPRMGNIGENPREVILEPVPVEVPMPEPAPVPEPVPSD